MKIVYSIHVFLSIPLHTRILHVLHDDLLAIGGVDHLLALTARNHLQAEERKTLIFYTEINWRED